MNNEMMAILLQRLMAEATLVLLMMAMPVMEDLAVIRMFVSSEQMKENQWQVIRGVESLYEVMALEVMKNNEMMEILITVMAVVHHEPLKTLMHEIEHQPQTLTHDKSVQK